ILIIPKKHVKSLDDASDFELLGRMFSLAAALARQEKISKTGYRTVINTGKDGGQSVDHLHIHLIGGRAMTWPPGQPRNPFPPHLCWREVRESSSVAESSTASR